MGTTESGPATDPRPSRRWVYLSTGGFVVLVAAGVAVALFGRSKPSDEAAFNNLVRQLAAHKVDKIDCRGLPKVGDQQLVALSTSSGTAHLKELVLDDTEVTDEGVRALSWMPNLTTLSLSKIRVTDAGFGHLPKIANLKVLRADRTRLTDLGLQAVGELTMLDSLSLWQCPITDAGLVHLKKLTRLETLSLDETQVTGAGLRQHLAGHPALKTLSVWKTKVGAAEADELKKVIPTLQKVNR